jgi:hypothetical protein
MVRDRVRTPWSLSDLVVISFGERTIQWACFGQRLLGSILRNH